eukprot:TRINITY_DN479_c0_g1_i1.p5 TRINITY_DN479_c0_g1~~TRINITY_DN479_c0_g1_i1.p5  ORF type:complete len:108 (+),score=32.87 TRINITY_DN479_c0_g1_i1:91-414(+)
MKLAVYAVVLLLATSLAAARRLPDAPLGPITESTIVPGRTPRSPVFGEAPFTRAPRRTRAPTAPAAAAVADDDDDVDVAPVASPEALVAAPSSLSPFSLLSLLFPAY